MTPHTPMQIGMVGLGRMGANLVRRVMRDGHNRLVYDTDPDAVASMEADGADADTIINGGNSSCRDDIRRVGELSRRGIILIGSGTSGGVWGIERGSRLMIGGDRDVVERLDPVFATIAPAMDSATRTAGRTGEPDSGESGYLNCGPHGAGHFVKMVHNGIEHGSMASSRGGRTSCDTPTPAPPVRHTTATPKPPRWNTRSSTSSTSTPPRWPRYGAVAASSSRGCSI